MDTLSSSSSSLPFSNKARFYFILVGACSTLAFIRSHIGWDPVNFNYFSMTGYKWSHFIAYTIMGYVSFFGEEDPVSGALFFSFLWELVETVIGRTTDNLELWTSGGLPNQLGDVAVNMVGFQFGRFLRTKYPCNDCQERVLKKYEDLSVFVVFVISFLGLYAPKTTK